jgi:hypothetical protein
VVLVMVAIMLLLLLRMSGRVRALYFRLGWWHHRRRTLSLFQPAVQLLQACNWHWGIAAPTAAFQSAGAAVAVLASPEMLHLPLILKA